MLYGKRINFQYRSFTMCIQMGQYLSEIFMLSGYFSRKNAEAVDVVVS